MNWLVIFKEIVKVTYRNQCAILKFNIREYGVVCKTPGAAAFFYLILCKALFKMSVLCCWAGIKGLLALLYNKLSKT